MEFDIVCCVSFHFVHAASSDRGSSLSVDRTSKRGGRR